MAVARITAEKRWLRLAAARADEAGDTRLARELLRAVDRPSRMAELTAPEVRRLHTLLPSRTTAAALFEVGRAEARERARPRGVGIQRRNTQL